MTPTELLMSLNRWIVRALDTGNTPELRRLIARRDALLDAMRLRDEPDVIDAEAA